MQIRSNPTSVQYYKISAFYFYKSKKGVQNYCRFAYEAYVSQKYLFTKDFYELVAAILFTVWLVLVS